MLNSIVKLQFFLIFAPIFMILLGVMQIASEAKIKWAMESFSFLGNLFGKGFFMLL
mgnify:CR=1 FL=1